MSTVKTKSWVPLYIALGIVWGCSFIFIKLGLEFLTPFGVAFGRCALGAITLLIALKVMGLRLPRERNIWRHLWVVSLLLNVIPGILFALAQTEVTSILAGIINAVTPLMTMLAIMIAFRDEQLQRHQIIGLILGFIGVLIVFGAWNGLGSNPWWAIGALLLAVACYGISFPYSRKNVLPLKLKPEVMAATQLVAATFTLLPFFLFDGISQYEYRIGPVLGMLCLGIFGSGFAYIWNFKIMSAAGSTIASSVTFVTPVVAVIVGIIFLGEKITWNEPVGGLVVVISAAIAQGRIKLKSRPGVLND